MFVDVSTLYKGDAGTGIQRIVRATLERLIASPPHDFIVCPVIGAKRSPYTYVSWMGLPSVGSAHSTVVPLAGDVFFGLDLCAHILPAQRKRLFAWKKKGVRFVFVMYDILPLRHPEWFSGKLTAAFRRWIRIVAVLADEVQCISAFVIRDLTDWLSENFRIQVDTSLLPIDAAQWFPAIDYPGEVIHHCGVDVATFALAVGTIEPRKSYNALLDAFDLVWEEDQSVSLVIVGRPGWKTDTLQRRLRDHPYNGKLLFWLEDASDAVLASLYHRCSGVILPSHAEGLGLPLLEAAAYAKPILARNLEVYSEIAMDRERYASFPQYAGPRELADAIVRFFAMIAEFERDRP